MIANDKNNPDLGFGSKVIEENFSRFIKHDGSFNVYRKGVSHRRLFSPYHSVLQMSWSKFYICILGLYFAVNLIFTSIYFLTGVEGFPDLSSHTPIDRFIQLFFYSAQVITTLGSSPIHPASNIAHVILAMEGMTGMLGFALGAGLLFARFSNPSTRVLFSDKAVVAPYENGKGFMFRLINESNDELIQVETRVTMSMIGKDGRRNFRNLKLERDSVLFFPLNWTVVHPIDEESPFWGMTGEDLDKANAEVMVSITAFDKELSKPVFIRTSYLYNEIIYNAKFTYIIEHAEDGTVMVDPRRIHEIEIIKQKKRTAAQNHGTK